MSDCHCGRPTSPGRDECGPCEDEAYLRARLAAAEAFAAVAINRAMKAERVVEAAREAEQAWSNANACPPSNECHVECWTAADEAATALRAALAQVEEPAPRCERCGGCGEIDIGSEDNAIWTTCKACGGTGRGA